MGPTFRFVGGDLGQISQNNFRLQTLGTSKRAFSGSEFEFFVRENQFRPFVRFTYFPRPAGMSGSPADIGGFSGTQFVFGVDVLSPIYQNTLSK